jgi:hypothetical protein
LAYFAKHLIVLIEFFYIDYTTNVFKITFYKKALLLKAKELEIVRLPLLDNFRTFKENITIENIRLNQLILQY